MLVAINQYGERVNATEALKGSKYFCPYCKAELILKQGIKVTTHYAHRSNVHRKCAKAETEKHYYTKFFIANLLKHYGYSVEIEPYCPTIMQYPDILIDSKIVMEIQFSRISFQEIKERSLGFISLDVKVIWIIEDSKYYKGILYLNTFQAYFINHLSRTLITWNNSKQVLYKYSHIQHLEGRKFLAKKEILQMNNIKSDDTVLYCHTFKLSNDKINKYIQQCRRKNSVLEPTLSAMYQLRMTDIDVCNSSGFIFPQQLYIENHPVQWQLQLNLLKYQNKLSKDSLIKYLRFRHFYLNNYDQISITSALIHAYVNESNSS
ncbi:competence protein CoiA family protein [Staphylococcus sp. NRL 16/872]|uniref:competence protein CoiA n=1 Tax=Staphylococcus sp. NRL 16/872 TaxID=2930131 RepID=UPI001FB38483|nr:MULTISPECIES: competence protein CoiA family protein [unclassified Staphylococcus]MCJ1656760.1 transcription factor [Staphylococcus sp. NRL 21/187]MCJ1662511.1 transcription factor [Staphylococcus sp. NRL 18/288]MCJ1668607.1 transcription factor [Staphylococcus sp. NRL 19/737]WEN68823.1 competence protein CoiA family protein [Staphylococcus sp. NRL 16/872]